MLHRAGGTWRRAAAGLALGLIALQSGCMPLEHGGTGAAPEPRQGAHGFAVLSASPARTVFSAKGRQVVVAPTAGFCVATESLDVSGKAAFALLSDCGAGTQAPRSFPGVLTVSISGEPLIEPGSTAEDSLAGLDGFLTGEGGLALLGRGAGDRQVSVVATRRIGDGLYVLVDDPGKAPLPPLDGRFWRAFVELGGRMAMVTLSGFRDAPMPEEQMLAFLVRQIVALRRANGAAGSAAERELASAVDEGYTLAGAGDAAAEQDDRGAAAEDRVASGAGDDPAGTGGPAHALPAPEAGDPVYAGPGGAAVSDPPYRGPGAAATEATGG